MLVLKLVQHVKKKKKKQGGTHELHPPLTTSLGGEYYYTGRAGTLAMDDPDHSVMHSSS